MESSVITYGKTEIPYRVRRSDRHSTVAVTVAPGEGVVLIAPSGASLSRLDGVVRRKAAWIVERLRHVDRIEVHKAFWALLGKLMPDYEERKQALLEGGPSLGW